MEQFKKSTADIKFKVSPHSLEESNLILRRFYDEVSKKMKVGWNFQSFRDGTTIYVGMSSFGEMWIDYKVKGIIDNIYVKTSSEEHHQIVMDALKCAATEYHNFNEYNIMLEFETNDIQFIPMCRNNIKMVPAKRENDENVVQIVFLLKAYGMSDLKYVITQKMNYLKHLLCAYTNFQFECENRYHRVEYVDYVENEWDNYDPDWIDESYVKTENGIELALLPEFFDLFRLVLDGNCYGDTMRLLLNSAQEIYCGKMMIDNILSDAKYNIPGYVDLTDTTLVSALEPLSNIGAPKPEICSECGNSKYKIREKVKNLCARYMNEYLVKEISDRAYGRRSSFLHEGNARTNEFYSGRCVPLINPNTKNSMMSPAVYVDLNMFDYVTYVFRLVVRDVLKGEMNTPLISDI